jgi:hypothetical protein
MRLLTKEETLPSNLVWEKVEKLDEFTYCIEAWDGNNKYLASCDIGEYNILNWRFPNLEEDVWIEKI